MHRLDIHRNEQDPHPVYMLPHGWFTNSTTLTITGATTAAYPVTFDTDEDVYKIRHSTSVNPSQFYITDAGMYLITFSAIAKSTVANKQMDIWLSVDGTNAPRSNTITKFVGAGNERVVTVTFFYPFTPNQYFELYFCGNDAGISIVATGTQSNPTRPACPSIIMTVNKISN